MDQLEIGNTVFQLVRVHVPEGKFQNDYKIVDKSQVHLILFSNWSVGLKKTITIATSPFIMEYWHVIFLLILMC